MIKICLILIIVTWSRCQQNVQEKAEKNILFAKKKENLQFLTDENSELTGKLSSFEINNKSESQVFNFT